ALGNDLASVRDTPFTNPEIKLFVRLGLLTDGLLRGNWRRRQRACPAKQDCPCQFENEWMTHHKLCSSLWEKATTSSSRPKTKVLKEISKFIKFAYSIAAATILLTMKTKLKLVLSTPVCSSA